MFQGTEILDVDHIKMGDEQDRLPGGFFGLDQGKDCLKGMGDVRQLGVDQPKMGGIVLKVGQALEFVVDVPGDPVFFLAAGDARKPDQIKEVGPELASSCCGNRLKLLY